MDSIVTALSGLAAAEFNFCIDIAVYNRFYVIDDVFGRRLVYDVLGRLLSKLRFFGTVRLIVGCYTFSNALFLNIVSS